MTQTFENHARFVPAFHFFALPIFVINVIWSAVRLVRAPSAENGFALVVAVALAVLCLYSRLFALTVQDRVIRVEMMLRFERVLPAELRARAGEFSVGQLVSLRFAPDEELPALAKTVLEGKVHDRKVIKRMIKNWQGDYLRA